MLGKFKSIVFALSFLLFGCNFIAQKENVLNNERQIIEKFLDSTSLCLDQQRYHDALIQIQGIYKLDFIIDYPKLKYYSLAYESEILYYQGLFFSGADRALEAKYIAENILKDNVLLGNALNLLAINSEGYLPPYIYIPFYEQANELIVANTEPNITQKEQVTSNLGQAYIKNQQYEEAEKLLKSSIFFALSKKNYRTAAISYIGLSKLNRGKNIYEVYVDSATFLVDNVKQSDLQLFLYEERLLNAESLGESFDTYLKSADSLIENDISLTNFSVLEYYTECLKTNNTMLKKHYSEAASVLNRKLSVMNAKNKKHFIVLNIANQKYLKKQNAKIANNEKSLQSRQNAILFLSIVLVVAVLLLGLFFQKRKTEQANYKVAIAEERNKSILEERERLGKELHDGINPELAAIKLKSEILSKKHQNDLALQINHTTNGLIEEISLIIQNLNNLNYDSFESKLNNFILSLSTEQRKIFLHGIMDENHLLNEIVSTNLFRICQEIIHNSFKHSDANIININLNLEKDIFVVKIEDNSTKAWKFDEKGDGNGLKNIKSRCAIINAKLDIIYKLGTKYKISVHL